MNKSAITFHNMFCASGLVNFALLTSKYSNIIYVYSVELLWCSSLKTFDNGIDDIDKKYSRQFLTLIKECIASRKFLKALGEYKKYRDSSEFGIFIKLKEKSRRFYPSFFLEYTTS